jgi:glycosyltransferase involved in cell wall biosynthesis
MEKKLTIVIPTKNEEKYIGRLLTELYEQKINQTKIIISDNNSQDGTLRIVQLYADTFKLNVEIIKGGLPSVARNNGATVATTPYILFIDADVTFTKKNAIELAMKKIIKKKIVSTTPVYNGTKDIKAKILFKLNNLITKLISISDPFAIGAFTLVRKKDFIEKGGYDPDIIQSEDWWLSKKFKPKEFTIIPNLITQDNRRFKRFGYFNMIKMMLINWLNKNNIDHFKKNNGYWV